MATFLIFGGTHRRRALRGAGLVADLAPAPPGAGGPCGVAVRIADMDEPAARSALAGAGPPVMRVEVRPSR